MTEPSICFVCGSIYPLLADLVGIPVVGGAEVQQYLIGLGLRERGFAVSFVTVEHGQGPEVSAAGFRVLSFRFGRNKVIQALTLLRALRRAGADIYYVRGMPKYGGLIYLFCRASRRKIVQALASDVEVEPENGDPRRTGWTFPVHAAWRRRADLVIAQTHDQAERLRSRWQIAAPVVPSIVPVEVPVREAADRSDRFRVLWVGRMDPIKRVPWIVEIARRLPEMEFVVVGGRNGAMLGYDETVAPLLRAGRNVYWLGFVPYPRVDVLFRSAQVLLHTSQGGSEGFPNVFLQAWAAGIPVVSTGVNPDGLLTERGLGIATQTVEEAVAALRELATDRDRCQAMGRRAQAYVRENHRPQVVLPRIAGLFRELVQDH